MKQVAEWRNLQNGELHNVRRRRMRWAGHVACVRGERKVYKVSVGKPKGKRPLERLRLRWEDGIRMDFRETGFEGVEWIHLVQHRDW
jgi:hypothetical protein